MSAVAECAKIRDKQEEATMPEGRTIVVIPQVGDIVTLEDGAEYQLFKPTGDEPHGWKDWQKITYGWIDHILPSRFVVLLVEERGNTKTGYQPRLVVHAVSENEPHLLIRSVTPYKWAEVRPGIGAYVRESPPLRHWGRAESIPVYEGFPRQVNVVCDRDHMIDEPWK